MLRSEPVDILGPLCPPLRLIVTGDCNGRCWYCHHEGNTAARCASMPISVATAYASAGESLGLSRVTVSGGEPTLVDYLPELLREVRAAAPKVRLGLTTNGHRLVEVWDEIANYIDSVDLSIISLRGATFRAYTGVDASPVLDAIMDSHTKCPAINVNTVVIPDNIASIPEIIELCVSRSISATFMMPLMTTDGNKDLVEKAIVNIIREYKLERIWLSTTPTLFADMPGGASIRVKLPQLSGIVRWQMCESCPRDDRCGEFLCAVRVYPNGDVSPCIRHRGVAPGSQESAAEAIVGALHCAIGSAKHWTDLLGSD